MKPKETRHGAATADELVNKGNALVGEGDLNAAMAQYEAALRVEPGNARSHYNLGVVLQQLHRFDDAATHYARVAEASRYFLLARTNMGVVNLFLQEFARGWDAYELRFQTQGVVLGEVPLPQLTVQSLSSARRVAVRMEQGIGDQVLFSTLLPELTARGIEAIVELDRRLVETYARSLPRFRFVTETEAPNAFQACDHQCPIGSLAGIFRRSPGSFEGQPRALLKPDPERVAQLDGVLEPGRRVAISWRTFQPAGRSHIEKPRTAPLESFSVFDPEEVQLVDLQYGDATLERRAFDALHPGLRRTIPGLNVYSDLAGLMAAIACCDLVVTTSNVTAHIAGAIGKRTWLIYLAAKAPFHYWVPGPDGHSLWYPSVEIVTDRSWGTWEMALDAIARRWRGEANS